QMSIVLFCKRRIQLVATLENLKHQVQVISALALFQVFHILDGRSHNPFKTCRTIGLQNLTLQIVPQQGLGWQIISRSLDWVDLHNTISSFKITQLYTASNRTLIILYHSALVQKNFCFSLSRLPSAALERRSALKTCTTVRIG